MIQKSELGGFFLVPKRSLGNIRYGWEQIGIRQEELSADSIFQKIFDQLASSFYINACDNLYKTPKPISAFSGYSNYRIVPFAIRTYQRQQILIKNVCSCATDNPLQEILQSFQIHFCNQCKIYVWSILFRKYQWCLAK